MKTLHVCVAAAVVAAAGTVLADGEVADVTEQLSLLTAVYNGTNSYRAAQAESHLGHLRVWRNVSNKDGTEVTFDVDGGKSLTIDKLRGGRGVGSTFLKTGDGTLCIGDGAPYGGTIIMQGGTLAMTKRLVPAKAQLPADPFLHLDASDASSLVTTREDGVDYVTFWSSDGVGSVAGKRVVGVQASESWKHPKYFRPWLVEDALGTGLHALDFGEWNATVKKYYEATTYEEETWPVKCGGFTFVTNENYEASAQVLPTGFKTYIAVVGAQRGGGTVLCDSSHTKAYGQHPFERGTNRDASKTWTYPIAHSYTYGSETITPKVWQDGLRVDLSQKFDSPAFHIIAEKCDPKDFAFKFIGASAYTDKQIIHGGMMLAELFVYDRDLSDAEILDVQAYLAAKWFGAATPGYRFADGPADLTKVTVAEASTIYVPEGVTNRIGLLTLNAPLVKAGGGTLEVFETIGGGRVTFAGGDIRYADRPDSGDDLCVIAPGASLHLDPTVAGTIYSMESVNGTNKVHRMSSVSGLINMIGKSYQPTFVTNGTLNSLPMLFFGRRAGNNLYGGYLGMDKPLDGIRSVFMIWDPKPYDTDGAGNATIGAYSYTDYHDDNKNDKCYDFLRDNAKSGANARLIGNNGNDVAMAGVTVVTNGVTVGFQSAYPADDFELVEFHLDNPAHALGVKLVLDRVHSSGLGMMGDLIIYERELTDREKVQTRNYLMRKWFNATPKALPEKPASHAGQYIPKTVFVDGETSIEPGSAISNLVLKGEGLLVKRGAAEVQAFSLLDFTGTVEVAEGKFVLNGRSTGYSPKMATEGQTLRFDMSEGVILTDRNANGYYLYTVTNLAASASNVATIRRGDYPTILEEELNGLPVVRMTSGRYMQFYDAAGNATYLDDIQSIFWVIGSQEGGGFLMGGGTNRYTNTLYPFHRGTVKVGDVSYTGKEVGGHIAPLTNSNGQKEFMNAAFRLNFANKAYTTGLSGGYDLLSMVIPELDGTTYKYPLNAQGFAFDGRSGFINKGCQRLGEVLVYNRRLSAQEVRETETYLAIKWGLCNAVGEGETLSGVLVDSGATLDLGSTTQKVAFVSGGGSIVNGCVETPAVKFDFNAPGTLSAEAFSFADGFTVELRNVSSETEDGFYPIIAAGEFAGRDNARGATVVATPALPADKPAKLTFRAGAFGVRIGCPGLSIVFR